jgi:vanillate/4-hydroxybenzoate decarboxylase subunit C
MGYRDLREFLSLLEREKQLLTVKEPVTPEPDLSAIGRAAADLENGPAVFVQKIRGYQNSVALNVQGSWQNHALMLNLPKDTSIKEQFFALDKLWNDYPVRPVWVSERDAPVKEIKVKGDINLFDILPLFRVNKYDGGFFISKGQVVSKDPEDPGDFNKENVGIYRLQVKGKDLVGIQALPFHDIAVHLRKAEEKNEPLPVAICIGNDPVLNYMASAPIEYAQSEYDFAGALSQFPAHSV